MVSRPAIPAVTAETGNYTLDVLTEGGDTFVLAIDEYGVPLHCHSRSGSGRPDSSLGSQWPCLPGRSLAVTFPATEPEWWIDTGTTHTRTIEGNITLRAIPFYRPSGTRSHQSRTLTAMSYEVPTRQRRVSAVRRSLCRLIVGYC